MHLSITESSGTDVMLTLSLACISRPYNFYNNLRRATTARIATASFWIHVKTSF